MVQSHKYNKHVHYAWRFDPCEPGVAGQRKQRPHEPSIEDADTDDEFILKLLTGSYECHDVLGLDLSWLLMRVARSVGVTSR